ncbi:DNA polymerase III, gamma/tau subunit [Halovivax ruber XH-70]|uniref:Replication factor C small subunit n=1 Tax=Halovivax ruber (strain DSM 18193 / JCM 13892 / XH-70) TaxID=797302 RepID=L0IA92_HALRX|nr:AAA family ATPase [Halovivax ruber]AGB15161.1 DNA polymerase III, gamma/tau subunit [Halovivax ruber XH-70]
MDAPLWTEAYAPTLAELPQDDARETLGQTVEEPLNLILQGPPGSGKTASARALARETHDNPDSDLIEINVADFFGRTKTEIKNDPRFEGFLVGRSDMSKRDMINHVLKESASYAPVAGDHKTLLLDNAEAVREDFQQALRRIMEQHHRTTRFIVTTRQPTKLIPPIRSRCFPVTMRAPTSEEIVSVLEPIVEAEGVEYDADGLEFVAGYAGGNLREAILAAQTTAVDAGEITMSAAYEVLGEVGLDDEIDGMLDDAEAGAFTDARKTLDDLLVDEGLDGQEVLDAILEQGRKRYQGERLAELHRLVADIEFDMQEGTSDRIHVSHLLAELGRKA